MVYQIKTFSTPEEFNESFILIALQWLAFTSAGLMFLAGSACIVLLGVWFLSLPYSTNMGAPVFELVLYAVLITVAFAIPFKICAVACEDLTMNEDCMPSKKASHRSRNGGYYYIR